MVWTKWVLISAFIAFGCVTGNAQVYYSIDFSAGEGYVDGEIIGQPNGADRLWEDSTPDTPEGVFTVQNEALVITQPGTEQWLLFEFPQQTEGDLIVTWDWQYVGPADGNIDCGMCISTRSNFLLDDNPNPTWNEQGAMTRMQQDTADIDVRNGDWAGGGGYEASQAFPYADGSLISMRFEIDVDDADQSLNCYAQKEGESEVMLAENFGFRRETFGEGLNSISIWISGSLVDAKCIIDNIRISGPLDVGNWALY